MNDRELYTQILGITAPWRVTEVSIDPDALQIQVRVEPTPTATFACPDCHRPCPGYDRREERRWRHLDTCEFQTWLVARLPRVQCSQHGVQTVAVPWAEAHSRFTAAFACFARRLLHTTRVQAATAALLRITPAEVFGLLERTVAAGLAERAAAEGAAPCQLSIDEKQYAGGQEYLTVIGDRETGRVWDVGPTRDLAAVKTLLETCLKPAERERVLSVTLDLWQGFTSACREVLPTAAQIYDRFHAMQELTMAVDAARRAEHRRLRQPRQRGSKRKHGDSVLTDTRWWWLHNAEDLPDEQREQVEQWEREGFETAQVWRCKENFRPFYELPDRTAGAAFLDEWEEQAQAVANPRLAAVVRQFRRHREKLLAYLDQPATNALGEYLNARIQEIQSAARGFRRFAGYRRAILFFLGQFDLCPQDSP
jgi:transposase